MASKSKGENEELRRTLERLSHGGPDSKDTDYGILMLVYDHLPKDEPVHWFCPRADKLTQETAKFAMRLFAFNGPRVQGWKDLLLTCMKGCVDCVFGFQVAKVSTRSTCVYKLLYPILALLNMV